MQNAFCDPNGSCARMGLNVGNCRAVIPVCRCIIYGAREVHLPVIFTRFLYQAGYADGGMLIDEILPALKKEKALIAGSWDAEIVNELKPEESDIIIEKNRYSAFLGTSLHAVLRNRRIKNLVVCGVTTNMCVETTVRDASQLDYRVFVVADATAEFDKQRYEFALDTIAFGFGWIVTSQEALTAFSAFSG